MLSYDSPTAFWLLLRHLYFSNFMAEKREDKGGAFSVWCYSYAFNIAVSLN